MSGTIETLPGVHTIRIEKRRRVPSETGIGFTHVQDGFEACGYTVTLHWQEIVAMAHKAARNKSGKSHAGPVTIRIVERKPIG